ncbi:hypothetical protein, partial [Rossellomorea marisflavi]|uniref:hypothetical protein n=1 Tax=Rossellomorea marisflavi TaxID=189381 RepID=UPI00064ECB48
MSKGTIVYIGGFELPDKNAAAHRVINNGKMLRECGYDVVFIDVDKTLKYENKYMLKKNIQGFECWSKPYPVKVGEWIHYLSNTESVVEILAKYKNVKGVICYNYQSIAFLKLKKYCNSNKVKIFADCTEWYSTKGSNFLFKIVKGFDSYLRMRIIQKNLDGLIVISSYLSNYYKNCKNVVCIPPLVDLKEEKWNMISVIEDNNINLVYAGNPGKSKDSLNIVFEVLDEIKNEISNFKLNVVGLTREQYVKNYT